MVMGGNGKMPSTTRFPLMCTSFSVSKSEVILLSATSAKCVLLLTVSESRVAWPLVVNVPLIVAVGAVKD